MFNFNSLMCKLAVLSVSGGARNAGGCGGEAGEAAMPRESKMDFLIIKCCAATLPLICSYLLTKLHVV